MMLNILLITILIAVRINYISCDDKFTIHMCENNIDVRNKLSEIKGVYVPLFIIQNKESNPFNNQNYEIKIEEFYKSKNILHILVIPADKCVAVNNYLNDGGIYPLLRMTKYGVLMSEGMNDFSIDGVKNLYYFAETQNLRGEGLGAALLPVINKYELKQYRLANKAMKARSLILNPGSLILNPGSLKLGAENPARNQQTALIIPGMANQITPWIANPRSSQSGNQIIRQSASQSRNPVSTEPALPRNMVSNTSRITTTVMPVTAPSDSFNLNEYLKRQRLLGSGVGHNQGDTQSTFGTGESRPGPSYPIGRDEELQTRDLLSTVGRQDDQFESGSFFTPSPSTGSEFLTLDGAYKKRKLEPSPESLSRLSTKHKR